MRDNYEALAIPKPVWFYKVMTAIVVLGVALIVVLV